MANIEAIVQEGIAAIKAGRKDDARRILVRATELDERNEQAWLWLSACVDTPEEQQICLENVLSINPGNQKAQRGLEAIKKQAGSSAPPAPQPSADSGSFGDYDSNPFAGTGFDSNPYASSSNDPAIGAGWGAFDVGDTGSPEESGPSTSVEWGSGGSADYGSGKNALQPSAEEYDSWVSGLQLGSSAPGANAPAGSGYDADSGFDPLGGPFSESSSGLGDSADPFGGDFGSGPFGSPAGSSPFEDVGDASAPASGPFDGSRYDDSADPFASNVFTSPAQPKERTEPFSAPPAAASAKPSSGPFESGLSGAFDEDIFGAGKSAGAAADPFGNVSAQASPFGPKTNAFGGFTSFADEVAAEAEKPAETTFDFVSSSGMRGIQAYFRAIPDEIQADGKKPDMRLVLTVVGLGLLNTVSLALIVLYLMQH
jgi:hypothetical protein